MLVAFALSVVSGGLFPSDNAVQAQATNSPPEFPSGNVALRVSEDTLPGTNIGDPVSATDDDDDTLVYSLEGSNADDFDIEPFTGQLITKSKLDYEKQPNTYVVDVKATDPSDESAMRQVVVMVLNVDEPLAAPAAPTVTSTSNSTTSLDVTWDAPENIGPAITDYKVQYKKTTETTYTDDTHSGASRTASISGLEAGTSYHVRVRAENDEGDGLWSLVGIGSTNVVGNSAPDFGNTSATRTVAENTPPDQPVGTAVTATDDDSNMPMYSLAGADADSFDIDEMTGQIRTKVGLNEEEKSSYSVLVKVVDGDGGSDAISVTITVDNRPEPPLAPGKPTVTATENSSTSLDVSWDAPVNEGPPITSYNVQFREGDSGAFMTDNSKVTVTGTTAKIIDLKANTSYDVRVQAVNDEGGIHWSDTGTKTTNEANNPPVFSTDTTTRTVAENRGAVTISRPVAATKGDRTETLTYSLEGTDAEFFEIDESSGQLSTKASFDYEMPRGQALDPNSNTNDYMVTVKAVDDNVVDGDKGSDTITVTITVSDVDEKPSAPAAPTVISGSDNTRLEVTWRAPDNTGPPINDYDYRYKKTTERQWTDVTDTTISDSDLPITISSLEEGTDYDVQVRARNGEVDGNWSPSGTGSTNSEGNQPPNFGANTASRQVAENTLANQSVGAPVTATDGDSDPPTYSLEGPDAGSFFIDASTGQINTKARVTYNREAKPSYTLTVKAEDEEGGSNTIEVTITVENVDEPPSAPTAPTVGPTKDDEETTNYDESAKGLDVSWDAPINTGPEITDYDVEFKISGSSDVFDLWTHDGADTSATISGLMPGTTYDVRVRAKNGEQDATENWSPSGTGATNSVNSRPRFLVPARTINVPESTRVRQPVGAAVSATDTDGNRLTYTLDGPGEDSFDIVSTSGQIRTTAALNYEERRSYSLTVKVDDGSNSRNGSAAISVTIIVTNVDEPPSAPSKPSVMGIAGSTTSLRVMWDAPAVNMGPDIIDYDVLYRVGSTGDERDWPHHGTDTSTIITELNAGTSYQVQVRATNAEGPSPWSSSGTGSPDADPANNAPVYTGGVRNFTVEENTGAGVNIGTPVEATDADDDDLTYSLEGVDSASFEIVSVSGQIQTKTGVDYNHEATKNSYSVTVRAADDRGGSDTVAVTIAVTDSDVDEPPETPDAPTVAATSNSSTSLDASWTAPENPGPRITDYDYQYKESSSSSWTVVDNTTITATSVTIPSLNPVTSYDVQVRATNADGTSDWSGTGTGSTSEPVANRAPVFSEGTSTTRTVSETAQASSPVGAPVTATDADNDTLVYSLDGTDANSFDITSSAGQLLVGAGNRAGRQHEGHVLGHGRRKRRDRYRHDRRDDHRGGS